MGAGRTELIETIFGIRQKAAGEILIDGKNVNIDSPRTAIKYGMALLTEDRRQSGIFPMLSVEMNMTIASLKKYLKKTGMLDNTSMKNTCQKVENLSGGNQQKVLVARWLMTEPEILFLDEPTRGIDVGTKSEIHRLISKLAGEGKTIIMVSSELPEIMGMSDRILVMHQGKVTGIIENTKEVTQEELMAYSTNTAKEYHQLRSTI